MKKEFAIPIFAFAAAFILILSILIPQNIVPDKNGISLLTQASRFKEGENSPISSSAEESKNSTEKFYKIYTGGYILGAMENYINEKNAWKLTAVLSVAVSALLLFLTLTAYSSRQRVFLLMTLFFTFPSIIKAYFSASGYIVTMLFMSLLMFVIFIKTDFFLKWYLVSLTSAFLFIDLPFFCVLFYIIPIIAFIFAKKYQTASKSFMLSLGVLLFGIAMHIFCFFMYKSKLGTFSIFNPQNIVSALKTETTFFFVVSFIGIFRCPKYVKRYIVPALAAYPIFMFSSMFSHSVPALELCFLPPMFLGFASSVIHQKFYRKYSRIVLIVIGITVIVLMFKNISAAFFLAKTAVK